MNEWQQGYVKKEAYHYDQYEGWGGSGMGHVIMYLSTTHNEWKINKCAYSFMDIKNTRHYIQHSLFTYSFVLQKNTYYWNVDEKDVTCVVWINWHIVLFINSIQLIPSINWHIRLLLKFWLFWLFGICQFMNI